MDLDPRSDERVVPDDEPRPHVAVDCRIARPGCVRERVGFDEQELWTTEIGRRKERPITIVHAAIVVVEDVDRYLSACPVERIVIEHPVGIERNDGEAIQVVELTVIDPHCSRIRRAA